MAKTSTFPYGNKTVSQNPVNTVELGLVTNYALMADSNDQVKLNNKTAPIDGQEIVTIRARDVNQVINDLNIQYPSPVKKGVQYSVRNEMSLRTTDSDDTSWQVDEPIVVTIGIAHNKSGNFTNAIVGEALERTVSAFRRADGTWRFDDLMRSAERPIVD